MSVAPRAWPGGVRCEAKFKRVVSAYERLTPPELLEQFAETNHLAKSRADMQRVKHAHRIGQSDGKQSVRWATARTVGSAWTRSARDIPQDASKRLKECAWRRLTWTMTLTASRRTRNRRSEQTGILGRVRAALRSG
jgi:molybdopterin synthase catalytic subunit